MRFRDLFIKTIVTGPDEADERSVAPETKAGSLLTVPETPVSPGLSSVDSVVKSAMPPSETAPEEPSHIPHRGPSPFRPPPRSHSTASTESRQIEEPEVIRHTPATPYSLRPQSEKRPAELGTASGKRNPATPQGRVAREETARPREQKRAAPSRNRVPRHSSGWAALLQHLKEEPNLRVLDIGPTSPSNINFLTGMGHSVYMAEVVQEVLKGSWDLPPIEEGEPIGFDETGFFQQNLNFGDRRFDIVLLWTTIDYLPDQVITPLIARLYQTLQPGGQILAFFHTKGEGQETRFCRYHLIDGSEINVQEMEPYPVLRVYTNREIERLFKGFSGYKFFLAKDNVYEVIITR